MNLSVFIHLQNYVNLHQQSRRDVAAEPRHLRHRRNIRALLDTDNVSADALVRSGLRISEWERLERLVSDARKMDASQEMRELLARIDGVVRDLEDCL